MKYSYSAHHFFKFLAFPDTANCRLNMAIVTLGSVKAHSPLLGHRRDAEMKN